MEVLWRKAKWGRGGWKGYTPCFLAVLWLTAVWRNGAFFMSGLAGMRAIVNLGSQSVSL